MRTNYYILQAVAATAGDLAVSGRIMTVASVPPLRIDYALLKRPAPARVAPVTEVLSVWSLVFTYAANTVYEFNLTQRISDTETLSRNIMIDTSVVAMQSAALVCAYVGKLVTAYGFKITPSGSGTPITLTAQTGYAKFTVTLTSGYTSATETTAGVYPVGQAADLTAAGVPGLTAGTAYSQYTLENMSLNGESFGTERHLDAKVDILLINNGDGDAAALYTALNNRLNGLLADGTAIDPELVSAN